MERRIGQRFRRAAAAALITLVAAPAVAKDDILGFRLGDSVEELGRTANCDPYVPGQSPMMCEAVDGRGVTLEISDAGRVWHVGLIFETGWPTEMTVAEVERVFGITLDKVGATWWAARRGPLLLELQLDQETFNWLQISNMQIRTADGNRRPRF